MARITNRRDFLKLSSVGLAASLLSPVRSPRPALTYRNHTVRVTPSTFEQVLAGAKKNDTLLLANGIYKISAQTLEVRCNVVAAAGTRPILTRVNGYTPSVICHDDVLFDGIWLGGLRDETTERGVIQFHKRVMFQNNVIWNYYGGANDGSGTDTVIRRNVFVNCGTGFLYHPLYINNSDPSHKAFVLENIFIGGQAWHVHLWHGPTNTLINGNFSADADYCLAFQGTNNICSNNIWWKPTSPGYPINVASSGATANNIYRRNFHGPILQASPLNGHMDWFGAWNFDGRGVTLSDNHYYPATQEADKAPIYVVPGEDATYLGKTATEIDSAVDAIKLAFSGTVQQIRDNLAIDDYIGTLQSVIDKWMGQ